MYRLRSDRLREAAALRGDLSSYAISKRTGVPQSTLSRLRRHLATPAASSLVRLSSAYGVPINELIEAADTEDPSQTRPERAENSEAVGGPAPTASSEHLTQTA